MDELDKLEIYYIKQLNSLYPAGYNLSIGGHSARGVAPWNKGVKGLKPPKSAFKKGHKTWNAGKPQLSEETRKKQSIAKLGKHISLATEFKAGEVSAFKGRKHTPEALAKISANNGMKRAIMCIQTGEVFDSILSAANYYKIAKSYLLKMALSETPHKKTGLTFKFVDNENKET